MRGRSVERRASWRFNWTTRRCERRLALAASRRLAKRRIGKPRLASARRAVEEDATFIEQVGHGYGFGIWSVALIMALPLNA